MESLGVIEVNSVAAGIEAGDNMIKTANVSLVAAQAVCAGKYIILVRGDVSAVKSSVEAGRETAGSNLVDSLVIASVHPQVFQAINATSEVTANQAVGVIETYSLASCILSADEAAKSANVTLIELRLGRGLGGKSYLILTGDVSAVREAVRAGIAIPASEGMVARTAIIPAPHPDLMNALL